MEILKQCKYTKEGNDCLITNYICLIKLDCNLYIITDTESIYGSWTGNLINTKTETFKDYDDALNYMTMLIRSYA